MPNLLFFSILYLPPFFFLVTGFLTIQSVIHFSMWVICACLIITEFFIFDLIQDIYIYLLYFFVIYLAIFSFCVSSSPGGFHFCFIPLSVKDIYLFVYCFYRYIYFSSLQTSCNHLVFYSKLLGEMIFFANKKGW